MNARIPYHYTLDTLDWIVNQQPSLYGETGPFT
jgi:hypothetical protein